MSASPRSKYTHHTQDAGRSTFNRAAWTKAAHEAGFSVRRLLLYDLFRQPAWSERQICRSRR